MALYTCLAAISVPPSFRKDAGEEREGGREGTEGERGCEEQREREFQP